MLFEMINACPSPGPDWYFFFSSKTNHGLRATEIDSVAGQTKIDHAPYGLTAEAAIDSTSFETCSL